MKTNHVRGSLCRYDKYDKCEICYGGEPVRMTLSVALATVGLGHLATDETDKQMVQGNGRMLVNGNNDFFVHCGGLVIFEWQNVHPDGWGMNSSTCVVIDDGKIGIRRTA